MAFFLSLSLMLLLLLTGLFICALTDDEAKRCIVLFRVLDCLFTVSSRRRDGHICAGIPKETTTSTAAQDFELQLVKNCMAFVTGRSFGSVQGRTIA